MERAQVRWHIAHQACEEERAGVPTENPSDNQSRQNGEAGASDRAAQPGHSGMGQLSSQPGGDRYFPQGRSSHLENALALGTSKASQEISPMGERSILSSPRSGRLGLRR